MKYILLMTGTKEGVDAYKAWSEKDIQTHFAHLTSLRNDLSKSGEFVATEGLGMPQQAKVVRAGKDLCADHRWRVSRGQGICSRLLDCRRRHSGTSLRDCGPHIGGARSRGDTIEHAHRSAANHE